MAGLIPANPRQGNRLEYLAHYILSAFGTAVPVLRTEDVGVDFFCALGKSEHVGITIADSYAVQLKSGEDPCLKLGGQTSGGTWRDYELKWFLNLEFPLLFGVPHAEEKRLDLYSTSLVRWISQKEKLPYQVTIVPSPPGKSQAHIHPDLNGTEAKLEKNPDGCDGRKYKYNVGPPIVSCSVEDLNNPERITTIQQRIRELLLSEHLNAIYRKLGLPYWTWVLEVETDKSHHLAYNYDIDRAASGKGQLLAELVPFICALGLSYKAENDRAKLSELKGIAGQLPKERVPKNVRDCLPELFD